MSQSKFTIAPCAVCGTPFRLKAYRAADPERGKFCSPPCYWEHRTTLRRPLADRFWEKVDKNGPIPPHRPDLGPCWLWTGAKDSKGYGYIGSGGREGKDTKAAHIAWTLIVGPIPEGQHGLHHCDNPPCIRADPDPSRSHIFWGTPAENSADMVSKGRQRRGEGIASAKLAAAQVIDIRARFDAGTDSQTALAREYGVSNITVFDIVRRKTWRHLS